MSDPIEHLSPKWDPKSVKVSQLRSILLQHDVPYPSTAKKNDLVNLFESSIRPRAKILLAQLKMVKPSDQGILDGESQGSNLKELDTDPDERSVELEPKAKRLKKAVGERKKGKEKAGSVVDTEMDEPNATTAVPALPKRIKFRAASASTSQFKQQQSDSDDSEAEQDTLPQKRKQTVNEAIESKRAKAATGVVIKDRRKSIKYESGGESGFSDFNPFQSGGEDSPGIASARRRSSVGPRVKKSMSASTLSPRKSLPPSVSTSTPAKISNNTITMNEASSTLRIIAPASVPTPQRFANIDAPSRSSPARPQSDSASPRIKFMAPIDSTRSTIVASAGNEVLRRRSSLRPMALPSPVSTPPTVSSKRDIPVVSTMIPLRRTATPTPSMRYDDNDEGTEPDFVLDEESSSMKFKLITLLLLLFGAFVYWREETISTGFCDPGTSTNTRLISRPSLAPFPAYLTPSQLPTTFQYLLSSLHLRPTCTPCPDHAVCSNANFITCLPDYVRQEHPLRLMGILPLAPRCVPDTGKLLRVAEESSRALKRLRVRKGEVICEGSLEGARKRIAHEQGGRGEGWIYGMEEGRLIKFMERADHKMGDDGFSNELKNQIHRLAISDLLLHHEIVRSDVGDEVWYAAKLAEMPWSCVVEKGAWDFIYKHKLHIGVSIACLISYLYLRLFLADFKQDKAKIAELVGITLQQLRDQERLHHLSPTLAPLPSLAPLHLRDLILQTEPSPARRRKLWKQVEGVVEKNSNVRAEMRELDGEEMRVWEWVGVRGFQEIETR